MSIWTLCSSPGLIWPADIRVSCSQQARVTGVLWEVFREAPWGEVFGTMFVGPRTRSRVVLGLVSGPERRGPVGAHVCTVESGRAQRERQLGRQRPLFLLLHPPLPRCCQGTEARGLVGADGGQGLSDDSNLLTSTEERLQACCPELPTRPEAKASISPSPGSQLIF